MASQWLNLSWNSTCGNLRVAVELAKSGGLGYEYDDTQLIETTREQDEQIAQNALDIRDAHADGSKEYNVYTNNCTDACQDIIQTNTGINLPRDGNPRPNSYFNKLRKSENTKAFRASAPRPNPGQIKRDNTRVIIKNPRGK